MEKIAFLFPGQGSQYVGMSKTLYERYDIARQTFEEASDILGFDLSKLCFEGSLADLGKVENGLTALLTVSVVAFRVYMKEIGVVPQFCAGHSLGEYSALTCSGAIKFSDALKIVSKRSEIALRVAESVNGAMTIIDGLTVDTVMEECNRVSTEKQLVTVSCENASNQVAISGDQEAVQKVEDRVLELGGQISPLLGSPPFHCLIMQSAAEQLEQELSKYKFNYIRYPVIANFSAQPYEGSETIAATLTKQIIYPVRWRQIMSYLHKNGITMTIEMGPKNVLSGLLQQNFPNINTMAFDQIMDRETLIDFFPNNPNYKKHIPTLITKCLTAAVATLNYNNDNLAYTNGVVESYRKIQSIQEELEAKGKPPSIEEMKESLELLKIIFQTKKVPVNEQEEWFTEIFEETGTMYILSD